MAVMDRVEHTIALVEGVNATLDGGTVTVTGPKGTVTRTFNHGRIDIASGEEGLVVSVELPRRKEKALAGTWAAHLRNMVHGAAEGFTYKLKAVYSHFPMNIQISGTELTIANYFGERVPRKAVFLWPNEVKVALEGKQDIVVTGADKEKVGQTAAIIERTCTVRRRDRRVFQDGIYLVEKA